MQKFQHYIYLGETALDEERWKDAVSSFDRALSLDKNCWNAWHDRGLALFNLNKFKKAIDSLDQALAINPQSHVTWMLRGKVYCLSDKEEAIKSYQNALSINSKSVESLAGLGFCFQFGESNDTGEALKYYNLALDIDPENFKVCWQKITLLHSLGRHDEAISTFDIPLTATPDDPETWFLRGLLLSQFYKSEALYSYEKALSIDSSFTNALIEKGKILYDSQQYEQAFQLFQKASLTNKSSDVQYWLDKTVLELGNSSQTQLTLANFLAQSAIDASPAWEYSHGSATQKPMPKTRHSLLQKRLLRVLDDSSEDYTALPELRCTFGERSVVPDIAVVAWGNIPINAQGEPEDRFRQPPDWSIEILSPDQNANRVIDNLLYCLSHGSQLGWLVDPGDRSILVLTAQQPPCLYRGEQVLPGLPGFEWALTAQAVFDWLQIRQSR